MVYDCIVVGAGAAGIGIGCVLQDLKLEKLLIVERGDIGASFHLWPRGMRMITPSFTSNAYGMMDLNAIALRTSPAYTLGTEHPTGEEYADYLHAVAQHRTLPVRTGIDVAAIRPLAGGGFELDTSHGVLASRFVVWAAGEFQYPRLNSFPGAEHGIHNSLVEDWAAIEGEHIVIIGGYESGADAAIQLTQLGKRVTLIDRNRRWTAKGSSDPSVELSPFTKDRLKRVPDGRMELLAGYEAHWMEPADGGGYVIYCEGEDGGQHFVKTPHRPIVATGFAGSLGMASALFEQDEGGHIRLSAHDESTLAPGLFLAGPSVRHGNLLFCFIYKFRQRFGVVAQQIAERLGLDAAPLEEYRKEGFMLSDLSCCGEDCEC